MKPVNLNQFRKKKARAEKTARADANALKFGRSKADKARNATEAENAARRLDGHRRDDE
ncbi:DUF4169 family protein [Limimaricola cinnabarinus]|uniref:DUF4169 domain-containing protein n=1 Tax=Limimaricola cinnabarinus TaxID=1125964 RepID=A0A2G1MH07_9RHOB|nr:DUF4169 family protein [Limimaricola cinnabarinus]PHP28041.1 DUF4169 domain-containing protein [Limimaricola cinnabarinus]